MQGYIRAMVDDIVSVMEYKDSHGLVFSMFCTDNPNFG